MAYVLFTRLCCEIQKDEQTAKDILMGETDNLAWTNSGVGFVLAVFWLGYIGESFSLSYAVVDEAENILSQPPITECAFIGEEINVSIANFYTAFPHPGGYHINIYQNGLCTKIVSLDLIESQINLETE